MNEDPHLWAELTRLMDHSLEGLLDRYPVFHESFVHLLRDQQDAIVNLWGEAAYGNGAAEEELREILSHYNMYGAFLMIRPNADKDLGNLSFFEMLDAYPELHDYYYNQSLRHQQEARTQWRLGYGYDLPPPPTPSPTPIEMGSRSPVLMSPPQSPKPLHAPPPPPPPRIPTLSEYEARYLKVAYNLVSQGVQGISKYGVVEVFRLINCACVLADVEFMFGAENNTQMSYEEVCKMAVCLKSFKESSLCVPIGRVHVTKPMEEPTHVSCFIKQGCDLVAEWCEPSPTTLSSIRMITSIICFIASLISGASIVGYIILAYYLYPNGDVMPWETNNNASQTYAFWGICTGPSVATMIIMTVFLPILFLRASANMAGAMQITLVVTDPKSLPLRRAYAKNSLTLITLLIVYLFHICLFGGVFVLRRAFGTGPFYWAPFLAVLPSPIAHGLFAYSVCSESMRITMGARCIPLILDSLVVGKIFPTYVRAVIFHRLSRGGFTKFARNHFNKRLMQYELSLLFGMNDIAMERYTSRDPLNLFEVEHRIAANAIDIVGALASGDTRGYSSHVKELCDAFHEGMIVTSSHVLRLVTLQ